MPFGLDFAVENTGGAFKGPHKSESSLMTCEAELHGLVTRMVYSILSLIGTDPESNACSGAQLVSDPEPDPPHSLHIEEQEINRL